MFSTITGGIDYTITPIMETDWGLSVLSRKKMRNLSDFILKSRYGVNLAKGGRLPSEFSLSVRSQGVFRYESENNQKIIWFRNINNKACFDHYWSYTPMTCLVKVPNRRVDMDSWRRSACYP